MKTFIVKHIHADGDLLTPIIIKSSDEQTAKSVLRASHFYDDEGSITIKERPTEEIEFIFGQIPEDVAIQPQFTTWSRED